MTEKIKKLYINKIEISLINELIKMYTSLQLITHEQNLFHLLFAINVL